MISYTIDATPGETTQPVDLTLSAGAQLMVPSDGGRWWGHGFAHRQPAPLDDEQGITTTSFAVNKIQVPMWICTSGAVVLADTTLPLAVRIDQHGLQLSCPGAAVTVRLLPGDPRMSLRNLLAARGWPPPVPPTQTMGEPFWCTWTQWPRCVDQTKILSLAQQIRERGWPGSTIIIDDRWERCFGELTFGDGFPDPKALVDALHRLGFAVWLWVTPFVNREAATFDLLAQERVLVGSRSGKEPAMLRWWGGEAGLIDVTGMPGRAWLAQRLRVLRNTFGVDGFKIDGGDAKYQPPAQDCLWASDPGPNGYSDHLLALCEEVAPGACETRTAWLSQHRRTWWREGGKDSHWGADNGLRAMVALGLNLATCDYDLLMPDMIPGRVQTMVSNLPLPTDELMVRWTEASALFPACQFSYLPWNYAPVTAEACRRWAQLHNELGSYITQASMARTTPIMRPLWWENPDDPELAACGDAWLLGPDLLVAPVLDEGRITRAIHLPAGRWIDAWTGMEHSGHLSHHPAPCPGMPLFVRAANHELYNLLAGRLRRIKRGSILSQTTTATYQAGLDRDLAVTG
jgi:alpha-glucosidase (family GH31 glycosyl hydrolase)